MIALRIPTGGALLLARGLCALIAVVSMGLYTIYFEAFIRQMNTVAGVVALAALPRALVVPVSLTLEVVLACAFWFASLYLIARRGDSIMVLMCAAVGFMMPVRVAFMQVLPLDMLPAGFPVMVQTAFLGVFAALVYVVFALFPDGELRPAWVRWWIALRVPLTLNYVLDVIPAPDRFYVYIDIVMYAAIMIAQYQRFQQERSLIERQQTKWTLLGICIGLWFFFIRRLADVYLYASLPELYTVIYVLSRLAVLSIPIAITFALLRYRLYDVDWVLNRSLVYGGLTLFVLGILAASALTSSMVVAQLGAADSVQMVVLAASVVLLIVAFQPVYSHLQAWVDRHLFRLRTTPEEMRARQQHRPRPDEQWSGLQVDTIAVGHLVGKGTTGRVYEATYRDQRVAVKLLPQAYLDDIAFQTMLRQEMQVFQSLRHPNVCQMVGGGVYRGAPYIVMEYLEGRELQQLLDYRGVLTLEEARLIIRDIAAALDYLHERDIVHRDVKPRNIIVQDLRAVLTDFGAARHMSQPHPPSRSLLTTPDYAAPEQITRHRPVTRAADIYSLGVVAYRMVTGHKPFQGSLRQKMLAIQSQPPRDPRDLNPAVPDATAHALLRVLFKEPTARFATAGDFARAFAQESSPQLVGVI